VPQQHADRWQIQPGERGPKAPEVLSAAGASGSPEESLATVMAPVGGTK